MGQQSLLEIEVLSGPLDGATIELHEPEDWTRTCAGPLAFPWDPELGTPQARFVPDEHGWTLEAIPSKHGTYRITSNERIEGTVRLEPKDVLKASTTWLLVRRVSMI